MTPAANRPRTNADYRWTREKIMTFLVALSRGATVGDAGRLVGMSRQSAYRLRSRFGAEFAETWDEGARMGAIVRAGVPLDPARWALQTPSRKVTPDAGKVTPDTAR